MFQRGLKIRTLHVRDIRFPTSLGAHGTDAMHVDCNYSGAYVIIYTEGDVEGHGLTFTIGHGNDIVCAAVKSMAPLIVGVDASEIFNDFASFWRKLTSHSQLRWVGPEKGVIHLATAAIINALWDLWANLEKKPLWKLLVDMEPEKLVSTIDFRYITDVVTKEEAIKMLKAKQAGKEDREELMRKIGYPAYTTQAGYEEDRMRKDRFYCIPEKRNYLYYTTVFGWPDVKKVDFTVLLYDDLRGEQGWLGYSSNRVEQLCRMYLANGFTAFKIKVGQNLEDDIRRCRMVRNVIGWDRHLMVDANQVWDVPQAIEWMKHLAEFKPLWIEEPTSPDDILGHKAISEALQPLGIGVATGEMCCNRVMFKQFLQSGAMQFCQIDSCRIGGVNEILSVYLMAHKLGVPVCPHAGGVGLCEMVQHLQIWDYISLSATTEGRMIEFVDQQHEHFENPTVIKHAHYIAPVMPGYSTAMLPQSAEEYEYPHGCKWEEMFAKGLFPDPRKQSVYVTSKVN